MSGFRAALWVEFLKARRARVLLVAGLGFLLVPLFGGLFMVILKDPATARNLGLISTKAQLTAGTADWQSYLGLLSQAVTVGGPLLFAVGASWLFGREFADHTAKDLLALPTGRMAIAGAKLTVLVAWAAAVAVLAFALTLALGLVIGLPGWSQATLGQAIVTLAVAALLTLGVLPPLALVASAGRGYLPGMGFAILTLFLAQIVAVLGWGAYFPWAVPAIYSRAAGAAGGALVPASYLLVALTGLVAAAGTLAWWQYADQPS
jgi:ABC-2 type transport system permease protein